jgi:succinoglycan biosynthesis protein ExoM
MDLVSVVTPTFNRPAPLARALESLMAQRGMEDLTPELIVVDNSPDANARALVEGLAGRSPFPLRYLSEPRPGVASARNAGAAAARGRWIAFLDDDEEAAPDWLAALTRVARAKKADAVFGAVEARADEGDIGPFAPFFERRIDRPAGAEITDLSALLGTNNSLFDRASCQLGGETFDTSLNDCGGEDSLLLQRLVLAGKRFHFAPDARVVEWAPTRRLTWAYVKKRKFLSGQIRVFVQDMARPGQIAPVAKWMAAGLIQALGYGVAALLCAPFGETTREKMAAKAFGGLGKVLWTRRFRLALYGRGHVS